MDSKNGRVLFSVNMITGAVTYPDGHVVQMLPNRRILNPIPPPDEFIHRMVNGLPMNDWFVDSTPLHAAPKEAHMFASVGVVVPAPAEANLPSDEKKKKKKVPTVAVRRSYNLRHKQCRKINH